MNYEYHELANLFPLMDESQYSDLVADIKENGLVESIVLHEGKILDGRNRYNACNDAGVEPNFVEYEGEDALSYVISLNLNRRHLNESQRAMIGARLANMKGRRKVDEFSHFSNKDASEKLNVGIDSVKKAKKVQKEGIEDLQKSVEAGKVSVSAASDIATLDKAEQEVVVAKGEDEILKMATKIRKERSAESREQKAKMRMEALAIKPPEGKYRTIVIDPPWDMERIQMENRTFDKESFDYPTMSLDEIKDFKLPAHEECHLWLWTTQKYLRPSFDLLDAWDFTYLATFVWHKNGGFQPVGLPQFNCEFVLLARKGGQPFIETKQFFTCFNAPRREHSRKPDEFYDVVKRVCPEPRIDIFSREDRDGYDVWGLEAGMFDDG
jgi:N6-adenosine-specific RNA methylase IME4/ParB-like chromosome segregation protein Spo0J